MDSDAIELDDHPELAALVARAEGGASCRLTRHGRTVARVVPATDEYEDALGRGRNWKPSADGIEAALGAGGQWQGIDLDTFLEHVYTSRQVVADRPAAEL